MGGQGDLDAAGDWRLVWRERGRTRGDSRRSSGRRCRSGDDEPLLGGEPGQCRRRDREPGWPRRLDRGLHSDIIALEGPALLREEGHHPPARLAARCHRGHSFVDRIHTRSPGGIRAFVVSTRDYHRPDSWAQLSSKGHRDGRLALHRLLRARR